MPLRFGKLQKVRKEASSPLPKSPSRLSADPGQSEVRRILNLPVVEPMTKAEAEEFSRENALAHAFATGFRFKVDQARAMSTYAERGGVFAPVSVGGGKTLIGLQCAQTCYDRGGRKVVLIVPPHLVGQLTKRDIKQARAWIPLSLPINVLGGRPPKERMRIVKSGRPGLYILPSSLLSSKDTVELLGGIRPDLVIADEAHMLANRGAARTRRWLHWMLDCKPQLIVMSGTLTSKSLMDYHHLIEMSLGENSPVPASAHQAAEWAAEIDANACEQLDDRNRGKGPVAPLLPWAQEQFGVSLKPDRDGLRQAYRLRLNSAPGVVASGESDLGVSLTLHNDPLENQDGCTGIKELRRLIDDVVELATAPDGSKIPHAMHQWKWLNEMSCGFYNEQIWPDEEEMARRGISEALLEMSKELLEKQQAYNGLLFAWLLEDRLYGVDTPMLVGQEFFLNGNERIKDPRLYQAWKDARDPIYENCINRRPRAVRVCSYKIDHAIKFARKCIKSGKGCILWIENIEVSRWLADELRESFEPDEFRICPAGSLGAEIIGDPENAGRVMVASFRAFGTGANLQHFSEQMFLQFPRPAKLAEQVLGRLHRTGQKADELIVNTLFANKHDRMSFAATLNDSLFISQTVGPRQKLIYASYDPEPERFPPAVLRERGLIFDSL